MNIMISNFIETSRLVIIPCGKEILKKALEGNGLLEKHLNISVPANWTEFGKGIFEFALNKIITDESEDGWWTYFPILKEGNVLIGTGGYKGKPSEKGVVEIGYEISPAYRKRGLATEFAEALIIQAYSNSEVKIIIAHTLAEGNASGKILMKLGFTNTGEFNDPDDGPIWRWELRKNI